MKRIFPSLGAGHAINLPLVIQELDSLVDGFHLDLADGIFVPHILGSLDIINETQSLSYRPVWIHLMVQNSLTVITQLTLRPQDIVSFHYESIATSHQNVDSDTLKTITTLTTLIENQKGIASCALAPQTPLSVLKGIIEIVPHILLMTVYPGKSGQSMLPQSPHRYQELFNLCVARKKPFSIGIDGGITPDTLKLFNGQNETPYTLDIAVGSFIMNTLFPPDAMQLLRETLTTE